MEKGEDREYREAVSDVASVKHFHEGESTL
jgi:hypothetical protein